MANGQQVADENLEAFIAWSQSKTDEDFKEYVNRGILKRSEIVSECGFGRSALTQNPRIKEALEKLENGLRERGILPPGKNQSNKPKKAPLRDRTATQNSRDKQRLNALEQQNAALKAKVSSLEDKLAELNAFEEFLLETGRLPQ